MMPIFEALIGFTNGINGKKQFEVLPKRMSKILPPRSSGMSMSIISPLQRGKSKSSTKQLLSYH